MIVERKNKTGTSYIARVYDRKTKRQIYSKTYRTRREAVKAEAKLIEGSTRPKKIPTCQEMFELWLTYARPSYAERTWKGHEYYWNHYVAPIFGRFRADEVLPDKILKFKAGIENRRQNKSQSGKSGYSAETINKIVSVLSLVFAFGRDVLGVIETSPMDHIKRNRVMQVKHPTWTQEEIRSFLVSPAVLSSYFRPMLILAFTTGMRPGEICGLAESDLLPQHVLTISRGINYYGHLTELKTARSHRAISLSEPLYEMLFEVRQDKKQKDLPRTNDFLFVGPLGAPITPNVLSAAFHKLLDEYNRTNAPLPVISLYGARHSFATNLIMSGKKSLLISEIMGNSVATMEYHYAHLRETMHAAALEEYSKELLPDG